jgi:integrase
LGVLKSHGALKVKRVLTDTTVKNVTFKKLAKQREGTDSIQGLKLADGGGLYLWISTKDAKSWRYKYRLLGKERTHTIGGYPEVSLATARESHEVARKLVMQGIDPGQHKKAELQKVVADGENTFEKVARAWVAHKANPESPRHFTPGYAKKVMRLLEREVFPKVGAMKVGDVGAAELSSIMEAVASRKTVKMPHQKKIRMRERGAATTAIHIRQLSRSIFAYAASKGKVRKDFDPTWALGEVVSKPEVQHNKHLEFDELPALWEALERDSASEQVKLAFKLLAVTFVRTNELRNAVWTEFDLEGTNLKLGPHWLIPADKMKKRRDHVVPLSTRALELLAELRGLTGDSPYLFPNRSKKDGVMNPNTVNQALYRMGYAGKLSAHGFRGTASTALNERNFPPHVVEMQLAHWHRDKTEASYNHAKYWPERVKMMQVWADMLVSDNSNVVPFKKTL